MSHIKTDAETSSKSGAKSKKNDYLIKPLEQLAGAKPDAPEWFENAINTPYEDLSLEVEGATIRYSTWGERGKPGLLLVHGGRAHRHWWRPFAPFFSDSFRVAALDLSGLGDSDWRERYSLPCHAREIFAVSEAAGLYDVSRPVVVGHSFGGWATLAAVEIAGEKLGGAVVVDTPFGVPDPDEGYTITMGNETDKIFKTNRVYPTLEDPLMRFRLLPNQPGSELYLLDFIARNGLKEAVDPETGEKGWSWKFDPRHGRNFDIHFDRDLFLSARCPLAFIYGEKSLFVLGDGFEHMKRQAKGRSPFITLPEGHHHLMMDQPIGFVAAMRALLKCWPVRSGH